MMKFILAGVCMLVLAGCTSPAHSVSASTSNYFDNSGRNDVLSGGVKMIPIQVPMPAMDQKYDDPRDRDLLMKYHYARQLLRMPPDQWPEPVARSFNQIDKKIYIPMQGSSELGASGTLVNRDRTAAQGPLPLCRKAATWRFTTTKRFT
jgi:hypothetical protein